MTVAQQYAPKEPKANAKFEFKVFLFLSQYFALDFTLTYL